jgi:hypothetical protein
MGEDKVLSKEEVDRWSKELIAMFEQGENRWWCEIVYYKVQEIRSKENSLYYDVRKKIEDYVKRYGSRGKIRMKGEERSIEEITEILIADILFVVKEGPK